MSSKHIYTEEQKERRRAACRKYHRAHSKEIVARHRERRKGDCSKEREAARRRYARMSEDEKAKYAAAQKAYYEAKKPERLAKNKVRFKEKRDQYWPAIMEYRRQHPEINIAGRARRRAAGTPPPAVLRELLRAATACCYCGVSFYEPAVKKHIDHVVPVSRGGSGDITNLAVACATCNLRKSSKTLDEWQAAA